MSNSIYIITNTITDKVYIGQTSRNFEIRKSEHFKHHQLVDTHIYRAMRKYGADKFTITSLCSVPNIDDLDSLEKFFIREYDSFHNGYNMTSGGIGTRNYHHKNSTRKIIGDKKLGKLNYLFKGYYHTPFGVLESVSEIYKHTGLINQASIHNWCLKYSDRLISNNSICQSKYLKSLDEPPLGKTFKELGFWFEPI